MIRILRNRYRTFVGLLVSSLLLSSWAYTSAYEQQKQRDIDDSNPLAFIQKKYQVLTPKGKFWTGVAVGFVSSRLVLDATITVIKMGGIAFIGCVLFINVDFPSPV
jgi:hypothetical protein